MFHVRREVIVPCLIDKAQRHLGDNMDWRGAPIRKTQTPRLALSVEQWWYLLGRDTWWRISYCMRWRMTCVSKFNVFCCLWQQPSMLMDSIRMNKRYEWHKRSHWSVEDKEVWCVEEKNLLAAGMRHFKDIRTFVPLFSSIVLNSNCPCLSIFFSQVVFLLQACVAMCS